MQDVALTLPHVPGLVSTSSVRPSNVYIMSKLRARSNWGYENNNNKVDIAHDPSFSRPVGKMMI